MRLALIGIALFAVAGPVHAQTPQRIVGNSIGSHWKMEPDRTITETTTLTFKSRDDGPLYTIDFIARHPLNQPVPPAGAVDIVVTQHRLEDEAPAMVLRVDGETVPIVTRLHGKRSVVATVTVAELDRIASAGIVVDRTFDAELEFGAGQVKMLRATADRWLGRVR